MAPKIVTLVRHGQSEHNVTLNFQMHDPSLTPFGETQCHELSKEFPSEPPVDLLVSSPLKRTIQTTLFGFEKQVEGGIKVELLAELQEASGKPCDIGSGRDVLEKEELFQGLDFSGLPDDWTSKALYEGRWAPDPRSLSERARIARKWLKSRSESHVVVITHGHFLHYLTEERDSDGKVPSSRWEKTEFRSYAFVKGDEENASIIETNESKERRKASEEPVAETEMKQFEEVVRN